MLRMAPLAVLAVTLMACSGTIPSSYTPGNIVRTDGATAIGDFTYQPHDQGRAAPNQLMNTAAGTIYISENVVDLVRRATALELEKSGVRLDQDAGIAIGGDVLEFKADDLGYSVDWYYSIRYRIHSAGNPIPMFERTYTAPKKTTGKFGQPGDYTESVNVMIREAYEQFAGDPDVQAILGRQL